jgi:hypothetical protein
MTVSGKTVGDGYTAIAHEVNHTVFASVLRRAIPRWLDEGLAQFVESKNEHAKARADLRTNIKAGEFTSFRELMTDAPGTYPADRTKTANAYLEGFAVVDYLVNHRGGRAKLVEFVGDVHVDRDGSSTLAALREHYDESPETLELAWRKHWSGKTADDCDHFACKAPHLAIFDPALLLTNQRGTGIAIRSPVVGLVGRAPPPPSECQILMYSGARCSPCQSWKRDELPKIRAAGITVRVVEDDREAQRNRVETYPTFVFIHKGREAGRFVQTPTNCGTAAKLIKLFGNCKAAKIPTPSVVGPDLSDTLDEIRRLKDRLRLLESAEPTPVDLTEIRAAIVALEGIKLPIRIETTDGKVIRRKLLELKRTDAGTLEFSPIVLMFDEKILRVIKD